MKKKGWAFFTIMLLTLLAGVFITYAQIAYNPIVLVTNLLQDITDSAKIQNKTLLLENKLIELNRINIATTESLNGIISNLNNKISEISGKNGKDMGIILKVIIYLLTVIIMLVYYAYRKYILLEKILEKQKNIIDAYSRYSLDKQENINDYLKSTIDDLEKVVNINHEIQRKLNEKSHEFNSKIIERNQLYKEIDSEIQQTLMIDDRKILKRQCDRVSASILSVVNNALEISGKNIHEKTSKVITKIKNPVRIDTLINKIKLNLCKKIEAALKNRSLKIDMGTIDVGCAALTILTLITKEDILIIQNNLDIFNQFYSSLDVFAFDRIVYEKIGLSNNYPINNNDIKDGMLLKQHYADVTKNCISDIEQYYRLPVEEFKSNEIL